MAVNRLFVTAREPLERYTPPPLPTALLLVMVLLFSLNAKEVLEIPPPLPVEVLLLTTQLFNVVVPALSIAPPPPSVSWPLLSVTLLKFALAHHPEVYRRLRAWCAGETP